VRNVSQLPQLLLTLLRHDCLHQSIGFMQSPLTDKRVPPSLPTTARSRDNHFHDYALGLYERYKSTHSLTHSLAHFKLSPRLPRSPITTTSVYRLSFLQRSSCQALRASAERSAALVTTVTTTEVLPAIQPEATAVEIIARASLENNLNVLPVYG